MRIRPHRPFVTFIKSRLILVLPVSLIFVASAMAAEIHDAVRGGDAAAVARLLKKDAKLVNLADEESGATPLYHAVDVGNLELVKALLKAGAKVNVKTDDGMTPVLRAAAITNPESMAGLVKVLFSFLNSGPGRARIDSRLALTTFQQSAVIRPEEAESRLAILRLLVERGGSVSETLPPMKVTPLHTAILFSNTKAVEILLEHGADPEASELGIRPLHAALLFGCAEVVKVLIAHQADVNAPASNGMRPLHYAVSGNIESVRLLLDHGAEVNAVDKAGAPALHGATWSDDIFNLLLERGANPMLQQSDGTTTLHMACQDGSVALVEKLLQLHPDVNAWDGSCFTPLLNAAEVGRVDLVKRLVRAGANLKASEKDGRNALHLAAAGESLEMVQFLLDQKLAVNALSDFGETALMGAAALGRLETVTQLLNAGASVNGTERRLGMTALMFAARGPMTPPPDWRMGERVAAPCGPAADYLKIATILLDKGANWQVRDSVGRTSLHLAAISGSVEMVGLLLSKGMTVDTKDPAGVTPLHCAAAAGSAAVAELLISKGAEVDAKDARVGRTPLHHAARSGDVKTVAVLLAKGACIKAMDADKWQPLHHAVLGGNPEVISLLLEKGANLAATESHGATPLHCAAIAGQPQAARALLAHGASPAALDHYKKSPLHLAALNGPVEIVRLLLDHLAPVNGADFQGDTPLHVAAMVHVDSHDLKSTNGQPVDPNEDAALAAINKSKPADKLEIVKLLLKKGARPDIKNKEGITPIDFAGKLGTPEILAALKTHKPSSPGK